MNDNSLPLRTGVGIVVLNSKKQVFVGKRKDNPTDKWQMPQRWSRSKMKIYCLL